MKHKQTRGNRGQALVEFSFVFPLILLIIFCFLEAGMLFAAYSTLANAAREGARYGTVHPCDLNGIEATARQLTLGLNQAALTFTISRPLPQYILVQADYDYTWIFSAIVEFVGGDPTLHLYSTATMRVERDNEE